MKTIIELKEEYYQDFKANMNLAAEALDFELDEPAVVCIAFEATQLLKKYPLIGPMDLIFTASKNYVDTMQQMRDNLFTNRREF